MEEGQLKKEMSKVWEQYAKVPFNSMSYGAELLRTFRKSVDEAKKEWLEIEECELPMKINGQVDWQKTAELMELRNIIRNRWFKKWLGGEKE